MIYDVFGDAYEYNQEYSEFRTHSGGLSIRRIVGPRSAQTPLRMSYVSHTPKSTWYLDRYSLPIYTVTYIYMSYGIRNVCHTPVSATCANLTELYVVRLTKEQPSTLTQERSIPASPSPLSQGSVKDRRCNLNL